MGKWDFDDCDEEEFAEEQDRKAKGKNLRARQEQRKRERRDAQWSHERATREQ